MGQRSHAREGVGVGQSGADQHTEQHRKYRPENTSRIGCPEGRLHSGVARQIARVVRHVGRVGDLPQRRCGERGHEACPGEPAAVPGIRRQPIDTDHPDEREEERQARDHRQHSRHGVNQLVADHRHDDADGTDDEDRPVVRQPGHFGEGFAAEHRVRREESQIHEDDEHHHEQAAQRTELCSGLEHLGYTHLRALRRVQRHDHTAHEIASDDCDRARPEGQPEHGGGQRSGDDRQQHDVRAEPHGEDVARAAVPFVVRNVVDGAALHRRRCARRRLG